MQEHEARKVTEQILTNVKCNKCGKKMANTYADSTTGGGDRVSNVIGLMAEVSGSHCLIFSKLTFGRPEKTRGRKPKKRRYLENNVKYSFDMCEECLVKLFESFVIPVEKQEIALLF